MRVIPCRLSASDRGGAFGGFGILLLPQQARGYQVQEDTFETLARTEEARSTLFISPVSLRG